MITFIVSAFDRPWFLNACLASLNVNPDPKQVIVCGNSTDNLMMGHIEAAAMRYGFEYEHTGLHGCKECYDSANWVVENREIKGDWLCFPSDDSLYVCGFTEIMLKTAERSGAGLVHCSSVYRKEGGELTGWSPYEVLESAPSMGRLDKTCFIIRRDLFRGFPPHEKGWRDGALVEQFIEYYSRAMTAKAPGKLVLHQ